jgi:Na+/phosphate symporter
MTGGRTFTSASPVAFGALLMILIDPGLSELKNFAPTIIIVLIVAWSTMKIVPQRKEVRLRELDVQEKGIAAQVEIAVAVSKLADVSEKIAVEQRQATEIIEVAQRVNVNSNEKLTHAVDELGRSLEVLNSRMERVETATAAAASK